MNITDGEQEIGTNQTKKKRSLMGKLLLNKLYDNKDDQQEFHPANERTQFQREKGKSYKKTRSLNVAMSVAIIAAEALRQNKLLK